MTSASVFYFAPLESDACHPSDPNLLGEIMHSSSIRILESIGLQLVPPTPGFVEWLRMEKLDWLATDGMLALLPSVHSQLIILGREWGYLWEEDRIRENAEEYAAYRYLGIGSLADGSLLAVDTRSREQMIGSIDIYSLLEAEDYGAGFSDDDFEPFDLTFGQWLELIQENPNRTDIPG